MEFISLIQTVIDHLGIPILIAIGGGFAVIASKWTEKIGNSITIKNEIDSIEKRTKARKSIAGFHLREGQAIGCKVTLRGENMYNFMDKLISISLPRVRDFRGVSPKAFDGRGNYALGIKEQLIFPEISYDKIEKIRGFDIIVVTTANTDKEALSLLSNLGFPFME